MLVILFQRNQEKYERIGWVFHHDQQLEFEEASTDSSPTVTLHFDESSSDDNWEVDSLGPPKVKSFSLPVGSMIQSHALFSTYMYLFPPDYEGKSRSRG